MIKVSLDTKLSLRKYFYGLFKNKISNYIAYETAMAHGKINTLYVCKNEYIKAIWNIY